MENPKYEYKKADGEEHYEIVCPDNDLIEDLQDAAEELNVLADRLEEVGNAARELYEAQPHADSKDYAEKSEKLGRFLDAFNL